MMYKNVRRLMLGLCVLALQVCSTANAESDGYEFLFDCSREEITGVIGNLKRAVKAKDAKIFISMLQEKPDYYYFGPSKEEIFDDFDKAVPIEVQHLLLNLDLDNAFINWQGIHFFYPDGGVVLRFYPSCKGKAENSVEMNIDELRTSGVLAAHENFEKQKWEESAKRNLLVDLDNLEEVEYYLHDAWQISDVLACGIYSGGAELDAKDVIGQWVYIEDKKINVPVSSGSGKEGNGGKRFERYYAERQSCVISSTENITLSEQCRKDLGYIHNPEALQINLRCEERDHVKNGTYSMDTRSLLLADGGNVVLLSVWEIYVSLSRELMH